MRQYNLLIEYSLDLFNLINSRISFEIIIINNEEYLYSLIYDNILCLNSFPMSKYKSNTTINKT